MDSFTYILLCPLKIDTMFCFVTLSFIILIYRVPHGSLIEKLVYTMGTPIVVF